MYWYSLKHCTKHLQLCVAVCPGHVADHSGPASKPTSKQCYHHPPHSSTHYTMMRIVVVQCRGNKTLTTTGCRLWAKLLCLQHIPVWTCPELSGTGTTPDTDNPTLWVDRVQRRHALRWTEVGVLCVGRWTQYNCGHCMHKYMRQSILTDFHHTENLTHSGHTKTFWVARFLHAELLSG